MRDFSTRLQAALAVPFRREGTSPWAKLLKIGLTLSVLTYLGLRLYRERFQWQESLSQLGPESIGLIALAALLVYPNLWLEARKWQSLLLSHYPDLRIPHAIRAVVAGITTGIFTPNRIGEYAGRLWLLAPGNRLAAGAYTFLSRLGQMAATLLSGWLGLEFLAHFYRPQLLAELLLPPNGLQALRLLAFFAAFVAWGGLLWPQAWLWLWKKLPWKFSWSERLEQALAQVSPRLMFRVLILSVLRYLVFAGQYVLLLHAFGMENSILLAFALVSLTFWVHSAIPTITLTELGMRETVALSVMGAFGVASLAAFGSTFLLYLINILIPALLGLGLLYRSRL